MAKKIKTPAFELNDADLATIAALEPEVKTLMIADAITHDLSGAQLLPPPPEQIEIYDPAVEAVLSELQAEAEANDAPAEQEQIEAPAEEEPEADLSLSDLLKSVEESEKIEMIAKVHNAFDERSGFELIHNPANDNIQDTLKKQRSKMALPGIAAMMIATNTTPETINRSIAEGKRFNVYAIDKLNDLLHGLNSGHFKNAINIAVMKSLFKFRAAGVQFTGIAALAAASDKVKVEKQLQALLTRHTVSAATGPTQASSTMSALQALGVVINTGTAKYPIWNLTNAPVTLELERKFA